jgi:hypothetical protein
MISKLFNCQPVSVTVVRMFWANVQSETLLINYSLEVSALPCGSESWALIVQQKKTKKLVY